MKLSQVLKSLMHRHGGFTVVRCDSDGFPLDFASENQAYIHTIHQVRPYTMTSPERIFALCKAVEYIAKANIEGDFVECGVWRGGSMMAAANTLLHIGDTERHLYLFDTFQGMSEPTDQDVNILGKSASTLWPKSKISGDTSQWCYSPLDEVKRVMAETGYDADKIHYIQGKVEDTLPDKAPEKIALLRLDTDWYESTKHELVHLFPRLVKGGVLILDDYGYWAGARQATDEYLAENNPGILLNRIDRSGRIGVKP